jgi:DNA polymerase type B, organellar and viral
LKEDKNFNNKIITMDLETRTINGDIIPYCVCLYDGINKYYFYLSDYKDSDDMLKESINFIMKRKYNNYKIYFHNFSNFDGVFLIRVLSELSDHIDPLIKDNQIINLQFKFAEKYSLYFRDSYLLLPSSLKKLAKNFDIKLVKEMFPYSFPNNVPLDYIGPIPEFKYFKDKNYTIEEFNNKYLDKYNKTINFWKDKGLTEEYILENSLVKIK